MANALFFDLDGTLTDPQVGITRCIEYALEHLSVAIPPDLTWCIGPPLRSSFTQLVGDNLADRAVGLYRQRFAEIGWQENSIYPNIPEALASLSANGFDLYVATSKPHIYATKILQHFDLAGYFHAVFGSELDGTRTDKSDLLRYAKERLSLNGNATMVGDRSYDIVGARANGLTAIGVSYGYGTVAELEQAGAEQIAATPDELLVMLRSQV